MLPDGKTGHAGHPADPPPLNDSVITSSFESLGGCGHGGEFGDFLTVISGNHEGLLRRADLRPDQLTAALVSRLDGIGQRENTDVFQVEGTEVWWTRDKHYWMAMPSMVKLVDASHAQAVPIVCRRLRRLRDDLINDLTAGRKIFVFRNVFANLTDNELSRLHAAVRSYGPATLLYVRYSTARHPAGLVERAGPGLLIGYVDRFAVSPDNRPLGSIDDAWRGLCLDAYRIQHNLPEPSQVAVPTEAPLARRAIRAGARPRRIVAIGNCQVAATADLFRKFSAWRTGDVIDAIPSYRTLTPADLALIDEADIVVEQIMDVPSAVTSTSIPAAAERLLIPSVSAAFLWPFAGRQHPRYDCPPFMSIGPYGAEAGDSYLNRLLSQDLDAEVAADQYMKLDVRDRIDLNRLHELVMDRQSSRDAASGYRIADLIEHSFRQEQVFLSPYHPNLRVSLALARQFFQQLGANEDDIERLHRATRSTPFPKDELPVHPAVASQFGLAWAPPDRRYRFMNEGFFTAREYAARYIRFEWNRPLEEGLSLERAGQPDEALAKLEEGAALSPQSAAAHRALSRILAQRQQLGRGLAEIDTALSIEPGVAADMAHRGNILRQMGRVEDAEVALRGALDAAPEQAYFRYVLAVLLQQTNRLDEACGLLAQAVVLEPYAAEVRGWRAEFLESAGRLREAAAELDVAIRLAPAERAYHDRRAALPWQPPP